MSYDIAELEKEQEQLYRDFRSLKKELRHDLMDYYEILHDLQLKFDKLVHELAKKKLVKASDYDCWDEDD